MAKIPEYIHFRVKAYGLDITVEDANDIEFAPVRHGRWIKEIFNDGYGDYPLYVCSECRAQSARKRNYCYDCGAKMDKEVEE